MSESLKNPGGLRIRAEHAIEKLKGMKQPVVRICGPLRSGGLGYEKNLELFSKAKEALESRGFVVFDYFEGDDEEYIKSMHFDTNTIMEEYHRPILESGYIQKAFFLPSWRESGGATWERNFIEEKTSIRVEELPAEWLEEK